MGHLCEENITGIILAGGKSSRMGHDKGLKLHNGQAFIKHIINALRSCTYSILIITNTKEYEQFGYPCFPDIIPDKGPVGGIYTGLTHSETRKNLILSCDIPFITSMVLKNLISGYDDSYDITTYNQIPLISLYHKNVLSEFLKSIQKDRLSLKQTISRLKVKSIPVQDHILPFIHNINTPQQYKEARQ